MFLGENDVKIVSGSDVWTGSANLKYKYKQLASYKDLNGVRRNRGYELTFEIEVDFESSEMESYRTFRRLINADEVTFYPRFFEDINTIYGIKRPIFFTGQMILLSEEEGDLFDVLTCSLTVDVDEILEREYLFEDAHQGGS